MGLKHKLVYNNHEQQADETSLNDQGLKPNQSPPRWLQTPLVMDVSGFQTRGQLCR